MEIFLGKNGQTFGPYTLDQFEALKQTPEFTTYTFIWDSRDSNPQWKALEAAPAAPPSPKKRPSAPPPSEIALTSEAPFIEVACHNSRALITGRLASINNQGCELLCDNHPSECLFGQKTPVTLNLLDSRNGNSMSVAAQLSGFHRKNGAWTYQLTWKTCPTLLS
ncbi:hypothetical protein WDW37_16730 [Bdellovibrionota bacterium FG-1]